MADEPSEAALRDARLIVAAAIGAAGDRGASSARWKGRVNASIVEIAAMLGPGSHQMKRALAMGTAHVFFTEYLGFNTEYNTDKGKPDRSTRIQVMLKHAVDRGHPDGVQYIRTERTDTAAGEAMKNRLAQIEVGNDVICWRVSEPMGTGETMAVLYHIEDIGKRKDAAESPPRRDPEGATPSGPSGSTSDEVVTAEVQALRDATKGWTLEQKNSLRQKLTMKGLWPPDANNIDRILLEARNDEEPF